MCMAVIYNHKMMEGRRRQLRGNMTKAERIFWYAVRAEQILGVKFRRQYSVEAYVVDFYAAIPRLVVEIDGAYHLDPEIQAYDITRQTDIENHGLTFMRFTNDDVITNLDEVISRLKITLERLLAQRGTPPLEQGED